MKINAKGIIYFIPIFLYPPLQFTYVFPAPFRITLMVFLVVSLFLGSRNIVKKDLMISTLLLLLYVNFIVINISSTEGLITSSSVLLTFVLAYALGRGVAKSQKIKVRLIKTYRFLFLLIPLFSVASIVYYKLFGQYNIFPPYTEGYNYIYTPFGAMLTKSLFGIEVYRSFFYFIEPVYLGFFYAVNIFYFPKDYRKKVDYFLWANVIGGILTFSFLFYFLVILFLILKKNSVLDSVWKKTIIIILLVVVYLGVDVMGDSSSSERLYRMSLFFGMMNEFSLAQFMFGHGFVTDTGVGKSFSAGLLTSIYEVGVFNVFLMVMFFGTISNNKSYMYTLLFISMLMFEPIKLPLFWTLMVILSVVDIEKDGKKELKNMIICKHIISA